MTQDTTPTPAGGFDASRLFRTRDGDHAFDLTIYGRVNDIETSWNLDGSHYWGNRSLDLVNIDPTPVAPVPSGADGDDVCRTPGCCTCDLPRCPKCNYTRHDAAHCMDHRFCDGTIPDAGRPAAEASAAPGDATCSFSFNDGFTDADRLDELERNKPKYWTETASAWIIALARRATQAPPQSPDPVAWQWKAGPGPIGFDDACWEVTKTEAKAAEFAGYFGGEYRPLYAAPPQSADARVAELEAIHRDLRELVRFLVENEPDAPLADSGYVVLDLWRARARAALAEEPWS